MKSYFKGLITGGVLFITFVVLTGQRHEHHDNHKHHDKDGHHNNDDIMHKLEDLEAKLEAIENGGVFCYNID